MTAPIPVEVVQLTLAPAEAVWLYSAMRVGHLVAIGRAAFLAGDRDEAAAATLEANEQLADLFRAASLLAPGFSVAVMGRLERLIKATSIADRVAFVDDGP